VKIHPHPEAIIWKITKIERWIGADTTAAGCPRLSLNIRSETVADCYPDTFKPPASVPGTDTETETDDQLGSVRRQRSRLSICHHHARGHSHRRLPTSNHCLSNTHNGTCYTEPAIPSPCQPLSTRRTITTRMRSTSREEMP
jgi:hypothetical protein